MAINPIKKTFGTKKTLNYMGKDFDSFKQNLIDYTKTYFPNKLLARVFYGLGMALE